MAMNHNQPLENMAAEEQDELLATLEEIISVFGMNRVAQALGHSSVAELLATKTDNASKRVVMCLIRDIAFSENPRLEAEVMALGCGIMLGDDMTMTKIAAKHAITKAAVSKRVLAFTDANGLRPSVFMRSTKDRKTYSLTNRARMAGVPAVAMA